jgi:NAD(P)-dependent dehydrogenase (short-subunit alcohol dehydrogenase family)
MINDVTASLFAALGHAIAEAGHSRSALPSLELGVVVASILVTGAAKGIGEACVLRLATAGHQVFAGVRQTSDGDALRKKAGDRVVPVILDVTNPQQIADAAAQLASALPNGLNGLVNNAGIAVAGPLEFLPLDALRKQLEVNLIGQLAVTQAMLPGIRTARGRIVFIGSVAGRSAMPMTGPYSASKFALEGLADSLRVELRLFGIEVALIEPGVIATPIWETSLAAARELSVQMSPRAFELYGKIIEGVRRRATSGTAKGLPPDRVAQVVEHALFANRPRTRYVVGRDARVRILLEKLPARIRDALIQRKLERL